MGFSLFPQVPIFDILGLGSWLVEEEEEMDEDGFFFFFFCLWWPGAEEEEEKGKEAREQELWGLIIFGKASVEYSTYMRFLHVVVQHKIKQHTFTKNTRM